MGYHARESDVLNTNGRTERPCEAHGDAGNSSEVVLLGDAAATYLLDEREIISNRPSREQES